MDHRIRVRPARNMADLAEVSRLQAEIWGSTSVSAPSSILRAISQAGGLALLAFAEGQAVGFTYGFVGRSPEGAVYHRSHSAGVLTQFRDLGIGRQLKLAQRRHVLAAGLDRIVWTFDPTLARNAYFNLRRLGATARGFSRDYYGDRDDALSRSGPTDRLFVEWLLGAGYESQVARLRGQPARAEVELGASGQAAGGTRRVTPERARLRRQLELGLGQGLLIIDFDPESNTYRLAESPTDFPPPAEGRVRLSSRSRSRTSSSLP